MSDKANTTLSILIATVGVVAVLIGVIVVSSRGSNRSASGDHAVQQPTKTPQEKAAAQAATEREAAEVRIASLSFKCIERYVCHLFPAGGPLPLFVDGVDEPLVTYLEAHGYTDSWRDNTGAVHGHTIGPNRNTADGQAELDHFVASYQYGTELPIGTGLIYEPQESIVGMAPGPYLESMPPHSRWTITWQLKNQSGELVRTLRFAIPVKECNEYEGTTSYCAKVGKYERNEANNGKTNSNGYSDAFYNKPPLFPY